MNLERVIDVLVTQVVGTCFADRWNFSFVFVGLLLPALCGPYAEGCATSDSELNEVMNMYTPPGVVLDGCGR